jgi:hypothetical protein
MSEFVEHRHMLNGLDGERLARLETKIDHVLENQEAFRRAFEKHDDRLKQLENARAGIYGVAGAIGAAGAFLMDFIKHSVIQR